ncbi:MAG TPA: AraC family transcriptional regulator, partial [Chthoniobacterales bacterium]|nr:AraC family transcriptional regulator [Chthoniobacterales bacterium]
MPLSLKCMFNGRARYTFGRTEATVDDFGYLILNKGQPYTIEIASPTRVESFIIWFPSGWAEDVQRVLDKSTELLFDNPPNDIGTVTFFPRYTRHDHAVSPKAQSLRSALKSQRVIQDSWLEEKLRDLLASMLTSQQPLKKQLAEIPALRAATREELWRRINLARDYLHSRVSVPVSLSEVATAACMSPFHLVRVFRSAFNQTPHQYLNRCRIER